MPTNNIHGFPKNQHHRISSKFIKFHQHPIQMLLMEEIQLPTWDGAKTRVNNEIN